MTHGTPYAIPPPEIGTADDAILIRALQARDERAFARVLDGWYGSMLRIAMGYVGSRARAEEVVQETWMAVLKGVDRFEGRSSLRPRVLLLHPGGSRGLDGADESGGLDPLGGAPQPDRCGDRGAASPPARGDHAEGCGRMERGGDL